MEAHGFGSNRSGKIEQQLSLNALLCVSNQFAPWVDASEKYDVTRLCNGSSVHIVDCRHADRQRFIEDAGGLDMLTKPLNWRIPPLPGAVPVIPKDLFTQPAAVIPERIVGINLKDILNKRARLNTGYYRIPGGVEVNVRALEAPVFRDKLVVLFSGGIDALIEHLWFRRDAIQLFDKIAVMGFYAVTGMNFSLIMGECPFGQALNINKSLVYCQQLDRRGIFTIPHIYAVNAAQRQRWIVYLNSNPGIKQVVMNTQLQKNKQSIANDDANIRCLLERTNVHILLQGRHRPLPPDVQGDGRIQLASSSALKKWAITSSRQLAG